MKVRNIALLVAPLVLSVLLNCGSLLSGAHKGMSWVLVIDKSDSMLDATVDIRKRAQLVLEQWMQRATMYSGSRFMVMIPGRDRSSAYSIAYITTPKSWGMDVIAMKRRFADSVKAMLMNSIDSSLSDGKFGGSDILSMFSICAETFSEMPAHDKRIVIISDMRQASRVQGRVFNFECSSTMPADPATFVDSARSAMLLPDLTGVSVAAYGLHNKSVSTSSCTFTAVQESALRSLWMAYLNETKANVIGLYTEF